MIFLVDDMGPMDMSVPMLTYEEGKLKRHSRNRWRRTPNTEGIVRDKWKDTFLSTSI
jgi:hypothetical protein